MITPLITRLILQEAQSSQTSRPTLQSVTHLSTVAVLKVQSLCCDPVEGRYSPQAWQQQVEPSLRLTPCSPVALSHGTRRDTQSLSSFLALALSLHFHSPSPSSRLTSITMAAPATNTHQRPTPHRPGPAGSLLPAHQLKAPSLKSSRPFVMIG